MAPDFGDTRATAFDDWATIEPEEVRLLTTTLEVAADVGLVEALSACDQQSPSCWRLFSTLGCRSKSASSGPTTILSKLDEQRDAWLTIPFVRFFPRRPTCPLSTDRAESVLELGLGKSSLRGS